MSVLERIVDSTRADVARRRRAVPLSELEQRAAGTREDRPFSEALTLPAWLVIHQVAWNQAVSGRWLRPNNVPAVTEVSKRHFEQVSR